MDVYKKLLYEIPKTGDEKQKKRETERGNKRAENVFERCVVCVGRMVRKVRSLCMLLQLQIGIEIIIRCCIDASTINLTNCELFATYIVYMYIFVHTIVTFFCSNRLLFLLSFQ